MKPSLLLLHGALGSKKQLLPLKSVLSDTFEIYDMDFEGHGEHISDREYSMELFTQNVIDFLDKHAIEKIDVFGYSMGGYVALKTALKHPERIGKIVTLGTKFNWDLEAAEREVRMLSPDKIEEKVPRFAQKLEAEHHPQDWKAVVRKTADMMLGLARGEKLLPEDFGRINNEVLIGLGSQDNMVSLEESEEAAKMLVNGKLESLEGVEHPIEKVEAEVLVRYLKGSF